MSLSAPANDHTARRLLGRVQQRGGDCCAADEGGEESLRDPVEPTVRRMGLSG